LDFECLNFLEKPKFLKLQEVMRHSTRQFIYNRNVCGGVIWQNIRCRRHSQSI